MQMKRSSGILLHPTSLPGDYGIGDLGPQALNFVQWMHEAGQGIWQLLPLGPTGYGDSPYAPFSSFAGNELLISPELLAKEGLIEKDELAAARRFPREKVDYGAVIPWKLSLLHKAAGRFAQGASAERKAAFEAFAHREGDWLDNYALFRALKSEYDEKARVEGIGGALWNNYWPQDLARRKDEALLRERERLQADILQWKVLQFFFFEEWQSVKNAAAAANITLVGDVPIFVAQDSAEVWAEPWLFDLDEQGRPREVAGVPPDYFSADGQLWGNPLYAWESREEELFSWWTRRLSSALERFDVVRIDHFRGFEAYWAVPAGEKTARNGCWRKAPGDRLFSRIEASLGKEAPILAEDLGFITEEVRNLRDKHGLPGMRILQFAFDAGESGSAFDPRNSFLPHNYVEHCVAYTGTHDNDTLAGFVKHATSAERDYIDRYLGCKSGDRTQALVRELLKSVAAWTVIPFQDVLARGSEARMNRPSTLGGNWIWRARAEDFSSRLAASLKEESRLYGRNLD